MVFTFSFFVKPYGPFVSFEKKDERLNLYAKRTSQLEFIFKNPCSALLIFAGVLPQHIAFAEHRISIKGDISCAVNITRAVERLQAVIFPDFVSRRLLKEFSRSSTREKALFFEFYVYGLPFSGGKVCTMNFTVQSR